MYKRYFQYTQQMLHDYQSAITAFRYLILFFYRKTYTILFPAQQQQHGSGQNPGTREAAIQQGMDMLIIHCI